MAFQHPADVRAIAQLEARNAHLEGRLTQREELVTHLCGRISSLERQLDECRARRG